MTKYQSILNFQDDCPVCHADVDDNLDVTDPELDHENEFMLKTWQQNDHLECTLYQWKKHWKNHVALKPVGDVA